MTGELAVYGFRRRGLCFSFVVLEPLASGRNMSYAVLI